ASWRWPPPTLTWKRCSALGPWSSSACAVAEPEAPEQAARRTRRSSAARIGAVIAGLALAALLAPTDPLPLPIGPRWLMAYLLFILLPGWLLVDLLRPRLT